MRINLRNVRFLASFEDLEASHFRGQAVDADFDIAIIGGGINGCGIARDAVGRGLTVYLCEQSDLASGTSSAATKLIHGGLRYLENYEFRLVRDRKSTRLNSSHRH